MLLTDGDIISSADMASLDSEVTLTAATSKPPITTDGPGSICELTWGECQRRILASMQSYTSFPSGPGMANHNAAVNNVGFPARTQPRVRLNQIVTSDTGYGASQSALKTWMVYHGLANFYRDASSRMEKDRYETKYIRYRDRAEHMWRELRASGLPMVYYPMECPGAKHAFNAGPWTSANLSGSGVSINAAQSVFVAVTWYDGSKYVSQASKGNAESGPSTILSFTIPLNEFLSVSIAGLNPPNGLMDPVGLALGTWAPLNATHWNLWVGSSPSALYLQQESIPIATKSFTLTGAPVLSGSLLGNGQYLETNLVFQNLVMRG